MLHGPRTSLRARLVEDVDVLHAELYEDVEIRSRAAGTAWRPLASGETSPFHPRPARDEVAEFSVVERVSGELLGAALLWGIDLHNRGAHVGISLRPRFWRQGYGTEVLGVLCRYGFMTLGLHRLQLETLADNVGMVGAARAAGFQLEGTTRQTSWVNGAFADDVIYGILSSEWVDPDKATSQ